MEVLSGTAAEDSEREDAAVEQMVKSMQLSVLSERQVFVFTGFLSE
jgi:hypothetical protein